MYQVTGFRHEIPSLVTALQTFPFHRNNNCRLIYAFPGTT